MVPVTLATFEVVGFPISNIQKMLIKYLLTVTFLDLLVEFTNGLRLPKWKVMYFFGSQAGSPRVWVQMCVLVRELVCECVCARCSVQCGDGEKRYRSFQRTEGEIPLVVADWIGCQHWE